MGRDMDYIDNQSTRECDDSYEDDAPLLDEVYIVKPKFKYHIEPVILAYSTFVFPLFTISSQYVIVKIGEDMSYNTSMKYGNFSPCGNISKDDPNYILSQKVEEDASLFLMYLTIGITIPSIFSNLFLGGYSDRRGRKFAIIPPVLGSLCRNLIFTIVIWLNLPKEVLYATIVFEGFGGGMTTLLMGCLSYISDNTDKENRAKRIVIAELCLIAPIAISNVGVGAWVDQSGFLLPFVVHTAINLIILFYIILIVPETIRVPSNASTRMKFDDLTKCVKLYFVDDGSGRIWKLQILVVAIFFSMTAVGSSITTLFTTNAPLCWDSFMISINLAITIIVNVVGSFVGLKLFRYFGMADAVIAIISGTSRMLGYLFTAFVFTSLMMLMGNVISLFGFLFVPILRTLISNQVKTEDHGAVFAGIAVLESIANIIGQVIYNPIYAATMYFMHGFVYFIMALFCLVGVILVVFFLIMLKREKTTNLNHIN